MCRLTKPVLMLALFAAVAVSCNETFPSLYQDQGPGSPNYDPTNGETGRIPILPTITDPMYDIYTRAEGAGAFEDFSLDSEHWLNADFRVFAMLADNRFSKDNASVDYQARDEDHCLLYDQRMRLVNDSYDVKLFDQDGKEEMKYYNGVHQNWKYNFFTYYADRTASNLRADASTVKVDVDIDGSQDLMHAMAYHTQEQLDKAIRRLGNSVGSEDKPLLDYGEELLYSTMAGHRGIHPIFMANHLLTRLDFEVKGAEPPNKDNGTADYRQIVVREVTVQAPHYGTLTIADDAWKDHGMYLDALDAGEVLKFTDDRVEHSLVMNTQRATDYYPGLERESAYRMRYGGDVAQFHVDGLVAKSLGKAIMLPPDTMFTIKLKVDFIDIIGEGENAKLGKDGIVQLPPMEYNIKYPNGGFKAGHAYTVVVSVYGPQQIKGSLYLNAWVGGQGDAEELPDGSKDDHQIVIDEEYENDRWSLP